MPIAQHTPGPWTCGNSHGGRTLRNWRVYSRGETAGVLTSIAVVAEKSNKAQEMANAYLIEAAPELLEALQILADHASETYPHFESERGQKDIAFARQAIAKATGQS